MLLIQTKSIFSLTGKSFDNIFTASAISLYESPWEIILEIATRLFSHFRCLPSSIILIDI